MVNIDHFKRINDERGHQAGDRILVALADRLALAIPADAVLARTGGETFAAILDVTAEDAAAIAERARLDVAERPFDVGDGPRVELTVSVGIATDAGDGSASELLRRADAALYAAKAHGRNRACHFSELAREIASRDGDIELENLENITRVVADRVTETIGVRTRRLFHEIREQADHDSLTGLPGRRYLDRRLPMEIDAANASDAPFTLALLDVDHFGEVNKEHGWPTGDRVLVEIATRVRRSVRATDWVARYGGEEISIALAGTTADQAAAVLERVREAVGDTPVGTGANGGPIHVTISIGAAQRQGPDETFGSLMERVSAKLLEAKRGGRNRVAL